MNILPAVRAELAERFLFNFRMSPDALAKSLPAPWLTPELIRGFGVVSYCLLDLRNITVAPLPTVAGLSSLSCAPRYAVLDGARGTTGPAVFVTERLTNSAFGAWFTTLGFSAPHPYVEATTRREGPETRLRVDDPATGQVFAAAVRPASGVRSELFGSTEEFAEFIARGVTSYGLSRHEGHLTVMDLRKSDGAYEPLDARDVDGPLVRQWRESGAVLDSAFRTAGGRYEWTYRGLVDAAGA